jgi:ubiquitin-protein ligase
MNESIRSETTMSEKMSDSVYSGFLRSVEDAMPRALGRSDILKLAPIPHSGSPPAGYCGALSGIEHFERGGDETVHISDRSVTFTISFPADYLRSVDDTLQFRIARVNAPLFHPNCREDGTLCLGPQFRPGTALEPLLETIYGIVASKVVATHHAFDKRACQYFLSHTDEVRQLRQRAPGLWRRPVAARVRKEEIKRRAAR